MMGFKSFWSGSKIIAGIETMYMIKKGQLGCPGGLAFSAADCFNSLATEQVGQGSHFCGRAFLLALLRQNPATCYLLPMTKEIKPPRDVSEATADPATPKLGRDEETLVVGAFRLVERSLLITVAAMTLGAAAAEVWGVIGSRKIDLADILLMFLYTEVIGMIAVFYTGRGSPFIYPIFIAITALARLIVLQGKDMAPENIVFEAGAILLLAISAVVIVRAGKS